MADASPFTCARRRPCCFTGRLKAVCTPAASWPPSCGPTAGPRRDAPPCATPSCRCADSSSPSTPPLPSHLLSEQDTLGLNPRAPLDLDLDVVQHAWQQ